MKYKDYDNCIVKVEETISPKSIEIIIQKYSHNYNIIDIQYAIGHKKQDTGIKVAHKTIYHDMPLYSVLLVLQEKEE